MKTATLSLLVGLILLLTRADHTGASLDSLLQPRLENLTNGTSTNATTLLGLAKSDGNSTSALALLTGEAKVSNSSDSGAPPASPEAASSDTSAAHHHHTTAQSIKKEVKHLEKKGKSASEVAVAATLGAIMGCAIAACGIVVLVKRGWKPRLPSFFRKQDPNMQKYYRYNEDAFNDDL